jgi:hypothetical protein
MFVSHNLKLSAAINIHLFILFLLSHLCQKVLACRGGRGEVEDHIFQSLEMSCFTPHKLKDQYDKLNPAFYNRKYRISREDRFN